MNSMTKEEVLAEKVATLSWPYKEVAHVEADKLLLDYIDDEDIVAAYLRIGGWYA